jgi:hypothetical protein
MPVAGDRRVAVDRQYRLSAIWRPDCNESVSAPGRNSAAHDIFRPRRAGNRCSHESRLRAALGPRRDVCWEIRVRRSRVIFAQAWRMDSETLAVPASLNRRFLEIARDPRLIPGVHVDTSVLVDAFTGTRRSLPRLRAATAKGHVVSFSAIVLYEWLRGPRTDAEREAVDAFFQADLMPVFGRREARSGCRFVRPRQGRASTSGRPCDRCLRPSNWVLLSGR